VRRAETPSHHTVRRPPAAAPRIVAPRSIPSTLPSSVRAGITAGRRCPTRTTLAIATRSRPMTGGWPRGRNSS